MRPVAIKNQKWRLNLLSKKGFSIWRLSVFVFIFGAIGAYLLFNSFAASPPENIAYGDLNGDNTVNVSDLSILLSNYATSNAAADINSDGTVNIIDLSTLLSHYGTSVPVQTGIYYVDPNGSDSNNGQTSPWKTVQHAVDTVPTGAIVRLNTGTYAPFVINKAGITVTNTSGSTPVVQGQAGVQDLVRINSSNVTVSGLDVTGCVPNGSPAGGGLENFGSSGVRINDGTTGVTVTGMTIHDSHGTTSEGLLFGCYGIMVHNANSSTISNNNIYHNGYGVFVINGGQNSQFTGNQIHDNDRIIRNTNATGDDYGGIGIGFTHVSVTPGPIVSNNTIYTNVGPSHDYETDGGAFEIYDASNVTFDSNNMTNNENILESGTGSGGACSNNKFTNNTSRGTNIAGYPVLNSANGYPHGSDGMYLRCHDHMLINNNTFTNISFWDFVVTAGGNFGGAIDHLTVTNNTITQTGDKVWAMTVDPSGQSYIINNNHFHVNSTIFGTGWASQTWANLAAWQSATGFDLSSTTF